jgi:amidohydrolase
LTQVSSPPSARRQSISEARGGITQDLGAFRPDAPDPVATARFEQLSARVDAMAPRLEALAVAIHADPELAFEEHRTVARLIEPLQRAGFRIERALGGLETAFRASASFGTGGPRIALLAEYDALPELGHACGHNLIGTAAVGAAIAAAEQLKTSNASFTLEVVGCPAEEGGGGKILLLKAGVFEGVDAALMFHPSHRTMPVRSSLAAVRLALQFHGKASHAATNPHLGVNALDACIQAFNAINAMRQHFPDEHRVHGIISNGGSAPNVVPDFAEARFMVRHPHLEQVNIIKEKVIRCAEGAAMSVGARLEVEEGMTLADRVNNFPLAQRFARYLVAQGIELQDPPAVGGVGSSDFGNLSHELPAIHPYVKIAPQGTSNHTPAFAAAAGSPAGLAGMLVAAKSLAATVVDLALEPDLLPNAQADFAHTVASSSTP